MYYYQGQNDPTNGNSAGEVVPGTSITEQLLNDRSKTIVSRYSNIGADNPAKVYPLPRSLFYDGAKLDPEVKEAEKYGLFMFYSFSNGKGNNYLDQYYLSERPEHNINISSAESKNPTAFQLVKDSASYSVLMGAGGSNINSKNSPIKGGVHAPYYWKDFIYCKYYGTIPNNRLITLRRFSSPVLDNFSIPKGLETPENLKKGIGMPVAQAVTWFGGKSGNTLSNLIGFSTGLVWEDKNVDPTRYQKAFGDDLLGSVAYETLTQLVAAYAGGDKSGGDKVNDPKFKVGAEAIANALSPVGEDLTKARYTRAFMEAAKDDGEGRLGILKERIWVPVDIIQKTQHRGIGLDFTWTDLDLKFTYDLTSVGEVNTKAAMFDILGNLLSIGTNYGNFLAPYIRYNSEYSALTFPGGDEGAKQYFTDPQTFIEANISKLFVSDNSKGTVIGNSPISKDELSSFEKDLEALQAAVKAGDLESLDSAILKRVFAGIKSQTASIAAEKWQAPLSLYTGAPIGEWHVVIGNPYNPIAMIGNLVCKSVTINFGDALGPDDFPMTLEATITLAHARPRERGEIESIFNRGDGRLYQTVKSTSANAQTYNTIVDLSGQVFTNENVNNFLAPSNGGVAGSEGAVTLGATE
jgi:hypothetical protein